MQAPLYLIIPRIIENLMNVRNADELTALKITYNSIVYRLLEDEETDFWHLSPLTLSNLICEELDTGTFTIPEEQ